MKKVMLVFGTRPEAIKMAPLVKELEKHSNYFDVKVVVTAQHREMLDQVLDVFEIVPDYDLNIMKKNQTLADITSNILIHLNEILTSESPDLLLVHGDTSTTFVASLAGFYNQIPIGHVEAGLRTWNKYSPFPEEANRQMTGLLSTLHFSPTERAKENLLNEGKSAESIFVTGNTVIDALKTTVKSDFTHEVLDKIGEKKLVLLTAHRRENLGENLDEILSAIKYLADKHTDIHFVYPVHLNPKIQEAAKKVLGNHERIDLIEPLGVIDFHNLISKSHIILTDSGGIQEEAPSFNIPVLVLRDTTERPEGVSAGALKLIGTEKEEIIKWTEKLLMDPDFYTDMSQSINPYGDGKASQYIVEAILKYFEEDE